jgi:hypothetical protein
LSLRPSIYTADLAKFRTSIAGERGPLVQSIEPWLIERGLKASAANVNRDLDQLLSGAWTGKPERDEHVLLVAGLAHACGVDSESAMIHWGNWKIGAYEDYFDAVKTLLPPASVRCFEFVRSGRPLFGSGMETEWSYYSYLTADEVRSFSADLAAAHARSPELDSKDCIHGFPTEFRGWMKQIEERNADLWLFAE